MRVSRNAVAAAAVIGLLAAGTAVAQERATRTVEVPADAVVLVLPPGARVLSPGQIEAAAPARFGLMPLDATFGRLDAEMNSLMQAALRSFDGLAMPAPDQAIEAALRAAPAGAGSSVIVTSFSDGRHTCTQRVTYAGNGTAPLVRTSGDACGSMRHDGPTPAAEPGSEAPEQRPVLSPQGRTIQVMNHRPVTARPATARTVALASLGD